MHPYCIHGSQHRQGLQVVVAAMPDGGAAIGHGSTCGLLGDAHCTSADWPAHLKHQVVCFVHQQVQLFTTGQDLFNVVAHDVFDLIHLQRRTKPTALGCTACRVSPSRLSCMHNEAVRHACTAGPRTFFCTDATLEYCSGNCVACSISSFSLFLQEKHGRHSADLNGINVEGTELVLEGFSQATTGNTSTACVCWLVAMQLEPILLTCHCADLLFPPAMFCWTYETCYGMLVMHI